MPQTYDSYVLYTLPNGKEIKLYYINRLAADLGRTVNTIRQWEIAGIIPPTCFRSSNNMRLYSQEQIDAVVRCAEKAFIKPGRSIAQTQFTPWVFKEFEMLKKKYMEVNPNENIEE